MRTLLCGLLALAVAGCTDLKEDEAPQAAQKTTEQNQNSGGRGFGVPGIAPLEGIGKPAGNPAPANNNPPAGNAQAGIPKVTAKVVETSQAMKANPNLKIVENKAKGQNYISFVSSFYVSAQSRIHAMNFQHNLRIAQAATGKPLTLKEFEKLKRQTKIEYTKLPSYQMYGYDSKTGEVVILEDTAAKEKLYKEKGIPLD